MRTAEGQLDDGQFGFDTAQSGEFGDISVVLREWVLHGISSGRSDGSLSVSHFPVRMRGETGG